MLILVAREGVPQPIGFWGHASQESFEHLAFTSEIESEGDFSSLQLDYGMVYPTVLYNHSTLTYLSDIFNILILAK